ncbi:S41 family peptidase [uncultured Polaribacter sp.]|uniref:S41 family peptidase n=1 Tax=uncultured Polaribacter sp. TaxID=174711 RepID=UPI0026038543|nr:S41 family peptidase [uncultured Polaribacter sp.]
MKKIFKLSFLSLLFFIASCEKKSSLTIITDTNDDINYFIWKGMNAYYLWQNDVPALSDNRFANFDDLYTYFRGFGSPESVFNSVLYQQGTIDRFSWIVDDYEELENSFQGINLSNGIEFGLVQNYDGSQNIFGYVRYVLPNSPADIGGVARGMIFNSIDGNQLTITNYRDLLFSDNTSYTVGFADFNDGNPVTNSNSVILNKTELQEDPIAITKVFEEGDKKIGYLLYNQFASSFDNQLNDAFSVFKSSGVNELIVDLRYNGGGSVQTATYLGSMITGQFNNQVYSKESWNDKVKAAFDADQFLNNFTDNIDNTPINSLGLESVYFIVSGSSASASELVINSLNAYIDVKLVGTTTVGKQVGSITLYDSDNLRKDNANLNLDHKYAIQPLVLEIVNKNDENEINGFTPGENITGINLKEDYGNLGILGERSDPLLDRTIIYITTGSKSSSNEKANIKNNEVYNSKLATPSSNNMFSKLK